MPRFCAAFDALRLSARPVPHSVPYLPSSWYTSTFVEGCSKTPLRRLLPITFQGSSLGHWLSTTYNQIRCNLRGSHPIIDSQYRVSNTTSRLSEHATNTSWCFISLLLLLNLDLSESPASKPIGAVVDLDWFPRLVPISSLIPTATCGNGCLHINCSKVLSPFACHGSINDSLHFLVVSSDHFFFLLFFSSRLFACLFPYFASRWSIVDPLLLRIAFYGTVESVHYIQSIFTKTVLFSNWTTFTPTASASSLSIPFVFQLSNAVIPFSTPDRYSLPRSVLFAVVCFNCLIFVPSHENHLNLALSPTSPPRPVPQDIDGRRV